MTGNSLRIPLRPLSRILPARARGENTESIERENIRRRHEEVREDARLRAQSRLLVLAAIFIGLYSVVGLRMGMLSAAEPSEPRAVLTGSSIIAQRADIVPQRSDAATFRFARPFALPVDEVHRVPQQRQRHGLASL